MTPTNTTVIAIGYAKQALQRGSREYTRQRAYARELGAYHLIVFTRRSEEYTATAEENFYTHPTHSRNKLMMLVDAYRLARRLASASPGPCVISGQDPFEPGVIAWHAARATHARFHLQLHNDFFGRPDWRVESLLNRVRYWIGAWLLRRADAVRVVSQRIKASVVTRGVAPANISVMPIALALEPFLAVGAARHYDASPEQFRFLFVGRFAPEKQLDVLLRALARARSTAPHLTLTLVGAGPEAARLRALAAELSINSAVSFVVWTDDVPAALADADAYLLSSRHEGYGLVLVEAMAAGLPIITTDVGCVGEVLLADQHGLVVPPTPAAFAAAMVRIARASELRAQLGRRAYTRATTLEQRDGDYAKAWAAAHSGTTHGVS